MTKPSLNIRLSRSILKDIDKLVELEEYASRSDFINRAVAQNLAGEGLRPMIKEMIREEIQRYMQERETTPEK